MKKNITSKQKVVVAMSGGVDSSVAAALLKRDGYEVIGVFMQFWFPSSAEALAEEDNKAVSKTKPDFAHSGYVTAQYGENRCCSLKSWHEAQQVAKILDIPIYKINFGRQFKKTIVDEFLKSHNKGQTPNPCVACNKFIKFDLLLRYARTVFNADFLATGHYVKIKKIESSIKNKVQDIYKIHRSSDINKDQTYFLYNLTQSQLKYLLFPLGGWQKEKVRLVAKKMKLPIHGKPDSQEICFVGKSHYDFLKKYLKLKSGEVINIATKKPIGLHRGLPLYTIGQRSGLGLSGGPWYVTGFDRRKNHLLVTNNQDKSDIYRKELVCCQVNWIAGEPKFPFKCQAQIRYHSKAADCLISKKAKKYFIKFKVGQRAIMAGQSVVFYRNSELLGGGIIE